MAPLGVFMAGKLAVTRSNFDMLRQLPISLAAKISLAFNMLKFQTQARKFYKPGWISRNGQRMRELDRQCYSEAIQDIHAEALPFFRLLAGDLCANQPEDVSSIGGMVSTIALAFGDCFVGEEGNESLHKAMLQLSGADTVNGAEVKAMRSYPDHVELTFYHEGGERTATAKYMVSALPADVVLSTVPDLDPAKRAALGNVIYGPYITGVFITCEEGDARWRRLPMMVSFDTAFGFVVNQSFAFYGEGKGKPGSVIFGMAFTENAKALMEKEEEEIRQIYRADMLKIFPEMETVLKEVIIQKWTHGLPGFRPGAYGETSLRKEPHGRIYFAGDYTADINGSLRVAVISAEECAAAIIRELGE